MQDEGTTLTRELRNTGIDIIGSVPWGTHFCQFYQTRKDLTEILIPYFKTGLENNEFCIWITSRPLKVERATAALKKTAENLDGYIQKGQIVILDASEWYTPSGEFEAEKVLQAWQEKEKEAEERGFDGLRIAGNISWLGKEDWNDFIQYEALLNDGIYNQRMIGICSYSLDKCGVSEVLEALSTHQFALIKRRGKWEAIENAERRRIDEELRKSRERYRRLYQEAPVGYHEIDREGKMVRVNQTEANLLGYTVKEMVGKPVWEFITPEQRELSRKRVQEKVEKRRPLAPEGIERKYVAKDGREIDVYIVDRLILDERGQVTGIRSTLQDITQRKKAEEKLKETLAELERSNAELEQFAYAASHDLQEPLRMVSSYVQLLAKRYKGKFDSDADDFIEYAVDGASRMQKMINDLLAYARVSRPQRPLEPTDCQAVLDRALRNLETAVEESGAVITHDPMPQITADAPQLVKLFQNLIGNAIKFRSDKPLEVHIGVERKDDQWLFWVRDNGIGIEPEYAERTLRVGAKGYIMKQEAAEKVVEAIRKVLSGEIYLSSKMAQRILHKFVEGKPEVGGSPIERLSDRELEVFQLIGCGLGTRRVAEKLHLSVKTVETYREHIKEKLKLKDATELVQHAIQWVQSQGTGSFEAPS